MRLLRGHSRAVVDCGETGGKIPCRRHTAFPLLYLMPCGMAQDFPDAEAVLAVVMPDQFHHGGESIRQGRCDNAYLAAGSA